MKKTADEKRILRTVLIIPALTWVLFFNIWESLYHFFERINRKIDAYMSNLFDVEDDEFF